MSELRRMLKRFLSGKESAGGKDLYDAWYMSFDDTGAPENTNPAEVEQELSHIKQRPVKQADDHTVSPALLARCRCRVADCGIRRISIPYYEGGSPEIEDYTSYNTATGERRQVVLPDGTSVWLNAGTQLRTPKILRQRYARSVFIGRGLFRSDTQPRQAFHNPCR